MVISPGLRALLDCIGDAEAGRRGYNAMYLPAERKLGQHNITSMTVRDVQALQQRMVKASPSSAVGRYQFIRKTLDRIVRALVIPGWMKFTPELQDRLALHLMEERGLSRFRAGAISREAFANSLAKEWASLPVVTRIRGQKRMVAPGETYYAGDGLNHARVKPGAVMMLLTGLVASPPDVKKPDREPGRIPDPDLDMRPLPETEDKNALKRLGALIAATVAGAATWLSGNPLPVILGIAAAAALIAFIVWRSRS